MDSLLQLTPQQRSELFNAVAQKSGMDAVVLEKDFWVCWTLKEMFAACDWIAPDFQRGHFAVQSLQGHQPFLRRH